MANRRFVSEEGLSGTIDMLFQVPDVEKPLASVLRILDNGITVFSRKHGGSYILNNCIGPKIQRTEETGTFVMDVEYVEADVDAQGLDEAGQVSNCAYRQRLRSACEPW